MITITAIELWTGAGTPGDFGRTLAERVLTQPGGRTDVLMDLQGLPAALLIGNLFSGYLQHIHDEAPPLLEAARGTKWVTDFDFQLQTASGMMRDFIPRKD